MAGMEGIEPIAKKEEEEIEEEEEDEEVVEDISRSIENGITLYQPELLVIYIAIHWVWKLDGTPWNDVEIKQIVGHAILELDEDTYDHLDLGDVTKQLCRGDDDLTKIVKIKAEGLKETLMPWIPQLYKKYLEMCKKDEMSVKSLWSVELPRLIWYLDWLNNETMRLPLSKSLSEPLISRDLRNGAILRTSSSMIRSLQCRQDPLAVAKVVIEPPMRPDLRKATLRSLRCWQDHLAIVKTVQIEKNRCRIRIGGIDDSEAGMATTGRPLDEYRSVDDAWRGHFHMSKGLGSPLALLGLYLRGLCIDRKTSTTVCRTILLSYFPVKTRRQRAWHHLWKLETAVISPLE